MAKRLRKVGRLRQMMGLLLVVACCGVAAGDEPPPDPGEPPTGDGAPTDPIAPVLPAPAPDASEGGAQVLELSLAEAVRLGAAANLDVLGSAYDAPIARQGHLAAQASFDTLLTAGFQVAHTETPTTNMFTGNTVLDDDTVHAEVGATRQLRSGGSVSLLYRADRLSSNSPFASTGWTDGFSVEASQPLLRGAGDVALADIRRAQNGIVAARAGYESVVETALLSIVEAYWELVFADENLDAKRKSEEVARELLDDANSRLAAEVGTPLDVAEARAGVERRRSEVLQAENLRATLQDRLLSLIMPFTAHHRPDVQVVPTDSSHGSPERLDAARDESHYVQLALQGRPELRASRADISTRGIDTVVARDAIRPQLDVLGRVASGGLDPNYGGALEDVATGRAVSGSIGLQFSLFVGQRAARANWMMAAWARQQAMLRLRKLQNQIIVEVRGALRDLDTSLGQVGASVSEVAAAQEALDGERLRLDQGKSTPFRILQKEDDLTAARTRAGRAAADVRIAEGRLWKAVGSLANNLGVDARRWAPCRTCR